MACDQEIIAVAYPPVEFPDRSRVEFMPAAGCGHETARVTEEATHG